MSLRSFLTRLRAKRAPTDHPPKWRHYVLHFFMITAIAASAIWLLMAIWYQLGTTSIVTWLASLTIIGLLGALLKITYWPKAGGKIANQPLNYSALSRGLAVGYGAVWLIGFGWFLSISPQQQRDWKPEVGEVLTYTRDADNPNLITFTNVRNFDWQNADDATERWETRTVDLSKLSGVDVINSYWMGPLIAHTLVSFRFEDTRPLSFSLEIRKEQDESFSALGGFFKRYELSLIASEERDIIYTRTNARGEQVYLFPVSHLQQHEVRALFESYLTAADKLAAEPAWYNTLTSNCTNIIFYMARIVSGERLPWDYRIWVSGWLPNYLYDMGMLDANPKKDGNPWSMDEWYERTHINPKVRGFDNQTADLSANASHFSTQIRQGIPTPKLAASQAAAESKAQSAALVSHP